MYDLVARGAKDFRIRIDRLHRVVRDPLEGIVGTGVVFRTRFRPVSSTPTPIIYTSSLVDAADYELDNETGTVVFDAAPTVQPTATYHWSNMTDTDVVETLFAGFHEMEGRWPRRFKLVDGAGAEVLYPSEASVIYVASQTGVDPPCGVDTFSTSAAERQLLLSCARYAHIASRLDDMAERAFMFREDRGLTVDKKVIPQNLDLALKNAESQVKTAIRGAQAKYYTSGEHLGGAHLQPGTVDYFEDYEWQTRSRDDDYRETYAGQ